MSLEYTVVCREALPQRPGGWQLSLGPVSIAPQPTSKGTLAIGEPGVLQLKVSSASPGESVAEALAMVLARAGRGAVALADGSRVLEDFKDFPSAKTTATEIERKLREMVEDATPVEPKPAPADPSANDWSDV